MKTIRSAPRGHKVLLEEELDAVRQRLEDPVRPGAVRPDAVLHVRDDLALEPDHEHHGHHQDGEGDDHLDEDDDEAAEVDAVDEEWIAHQVSVSTRTSDTSAETSMRAVALGSSTGVSPTGRTVDPRRGNVVVAPRP